MAQIPLLILSNGVDGPRMTDSEGRTIEGMITDVVEAFMACPRTGGHHPVIKHFAPDGSRFHAVEACSRQDSGPLLVARTQEYLYREPSGHGANRGCRPLRSNPLRESCGMGLRGRTLFIKYMRE